VSGRNPDSKLSFEREELRSRIEIDSLNSTTFNVGFNYSDPAVTYGVTRDIYAEVIQSLRGSGCILSRIFGCRSETIGILPLRLL